MDPATGRPFDRSLLEATLADAARAADTEVVATPPGEPQGAERHLGLGAPATRATPSSVASLTADLSAVRSAGGTAPAGQAAIDPSSLRVGGRPAVEVGTPSVSRAPAAPGPVGRPAAGRPGTPAAAGGVPASPVSAAPPGPDGAAAPAGHDPAPAAPRSELRPWQPSDDDLLPAAPNRRNRRGLRR